MERETLHQPLRDMLLSHLFEKRAAEEYTKGNIIGFLRQRPSAPVLSMPPRPRITSSSSIGGALFGNSADFLNQDNETEFAEKTSVPTTE